MEFTFAKKMEDMCQDILTSKKERNKRCKEMVRETHNFLEEVRNDFLPPIRQRCKEIAQETHNFLGEFRHDFLQPVRQDFRAASKTFKKFSKEFAGVH
jgi:hypothetical protein